MSRVLSAEVETSDQAIVALTAVSTSSYTFDHATRDVKAGAGIDEVVSRVVASLSRDECLWLLDGDPKFYEGLGTMFYERYNIRPFVMGCLPRLNISGIRFSDGPRGVCVGNSTAFPVSMARGATFDVDLERRIGDAIGKEAKAQGANCFAGVCINLPRHPAWGRSQETYSDDSLLLGAFGAALTQGVQRHVMACVKHFALNSMENARFRVDVKISDEALHEIYLPHFKRVIDAGVASVMSAYNSVRGEWAGQSKFLLTDILREAWKFEGFVISDFVFGLRDSASSLRNGLDVEAPFRQQRAIHLKREIEQGLVTWAHVRQACTRVLKTQLQFHLTTENSQPDASAVFCDQHRALAREAAGRSVVLLKNERTQQEALLPLNLTGVRRIAVIGRLAKAENLGDMGSSRVISPQVVTLAEALRSRLVGTEVLIDDADSVESARQVAQKADLVICIAGYSSHEEGEYVIPSLQQDPALEDLLPTPQGLGEERVAARLRGESTEGSDAGLEAGAGGDRKSLRLRARDKEIVTAVAQVNPRTVMTVICAGPVIMDDVISKVPVALISWYAGCEGGHGFADVLLGKIDASGRLPFSIPRDESHLPFFQIDAHEIIYDRWHGQRLLDKLGVEAAYPFGYGLSYATFAVSHVKVTVAAHNKDVHEALVIEATVENTSARDGWFVAQAYGSSHVVDSPQRVLIGFQPEEIAAGRKARIEILGSSQPLSRWVEGKFILPGRLVDIEVAAFAGDPTAGRASTVL